MLKACAELRQGFWLGSVLPVMVLVHAWGIAIVCRQRDLSVMSSHVLSVMHLALWTY